jgi:hypothetical protein
LSAYCGRVHIVLAIGCGELVMDQSTQPKLKRLQTLSRVSSEKVGWE